MLKSFLVNLFTISLNLLEHLSRAEFSFYFLYIDNTNKQERDFFFSSLPPFPPCNLGEIVGGITNKLFAPKELKIQWEKGEYW